MVKDDGLTEEEIHDGIMWAVEDLKKIAVRGQITMQGIAIMLQKYNVDAPGVRSDAAELAKAEGLIIADAMTSGTKREAGTR
jgi:hypothetical protein